MMYERKYVHADVQSEERERKKIGVPAKALQDGIVL